MLYEVITAWRQEPFRFFRWFAAYPVLYRVDAGNPSTCVWFQDLRFFTPGRGRWPFRFGIRITSYNVCYTKLLRLAVELEARGYDWIKGKAAA